MAKTKIRIGFKIALLFFGILLLSRLIYFATYCITASFKGWQISFMGFIDANTKWDALWYEDIIKFGYRIVDWNKCKYSWNFFPLYPLSIKLISYIIPINLRLLGFIVGLIYLYIAGIFIYKYIIFTRNNKFMAIIAPSLLFLGPWSYIFTELMSESLYIMILAIGFYCIVQEKYIKAGLMGTLLSATRITGVFFVFAILTHYFYKKYKQNKSIKKSFLLIIKNPNLLLAILLVPIGIFSYMIYLQITIHDGLGFLHSQVYGWGHHFSGFFKTMFTHFKENPANTTLTWIAFIILIINIVIKRGNLFENIIPITILIFNTSGGWTRGNQRYILSSIFVLVSFLDLFFKLTKGNKKLILSILGLTIPLSALINVCNLITYRVIGDIIS